MSVHHDAPGLLADAARPLSGRAVALAAVAAAPTLLAPFGPSAPLAVLAGAATAVVYVLAARHVARGGAGFLEPREAPGGARGRGSALAAVGRGLALYVLAAMPFVAAVAAGARDGVMPSSTDVLAAMLVTSLYLPPAIAAVVVSGHGATAFWPFAWMRVLGMLGPAVASRMALVFALFVLAAWGVDQAGLRATELLATRGAGLPWLVHACAPFLRTTLVNLVWFAQACAVGGMLRRDGAALGL